MSGYIPRQTHAESLSDINEAIDHGLGALDLLASDRDINASEVREHVVETLVLLWRLKLATIDRIEHEATLANEASAAPGAA